MKNYLLTSALAIFATLSTIAQESLLPDQNPQYAISRDKYMGMSDSLNQWHSTTFQETYKAFDWYENKLERRKARTEFRRNLMLERSRHYHRYYNNRYYRPYYHNYHHSYYRNLWFNWCF